MTKEEIKNADLKELTNRLIDLWSKEITICCNYNKKFFNHGYKEFKNYYKNSKKERRKNLDEFYLILKLRPIVNDIFHLIKKNEINIPNPHPGIYIKDFLLSNRINAKDYAMDLGINFHHLLDILNGKEKIDEEIAVKLSETIGLNSKVWIDLQKSYDESIIDEHLIVLSRNDLKNYLKGEVAK